MTKKPSFVRIFLIIIHDEIDQIKTKNHLNNIFKIKTYNYRNFRQFELF